MEERVKSNAETTLEHRLKNVERDFHDEVGVGFPHREAGGERVEYADQSISRWMDGWMGGVVF